MLIFYVIFTAVLCPLLFFFALKSQTKGIFVNCTFATFFIIYFLPLMIVGPDNVSEELAWSTLLCAFGLFSGFFFRFPTLTSYQVQPYVLNAGLLGHNVINAFFLIALLAIILSLHLAGGLLVVVQGAGGADYLNVRVNSPFSGILGLAIWLAPVPMVLFFYFYLTNTNKSKRWKLFAKFSISFLLLITGYMLLTVRHNAVATVLALFVIYICTTQFSIKKTLFALALILGIIIVFQSIRVSGADNVNLNNSVNSTANSFEHVAITDEIIHTTHDKGYTYFEHMLDVPIFFIPRAIWPEKPRTSFLNRYYFSDVARVGSEKSIGIVGEGYSALGYAGVFIISFVFSFFISSMQVLLDSSRNLLLKCFLAAIVTPYTYIGIRTGVFGKHMLSMILMCIEAYVIYFTFTKNNRLLFNRK